MMNRPRKLLTPWNDERGSTLVLVVLLTLVLSATAIVTLRSIVRTTRAVSVFRTRTQAQLTSNAASRVFADYVGNKGPDYIVGLTSSLSGTAGTDVGVTGGQISTTPDLDTRTNVVTTGGSFNLSQADLQTEFLPNYGDPRESGLFQLAAGEETFETRRRVSWRVRLSDLTDGFPAVNFSQGFCFKKGVVAAEAQVGVLEADWDRVNNVSVSRHMIDGMIGPYPCGYN